MAFQQRSEEESLARSHSKSSNFKLTLVCLLFALSIALLAASVGVLAAEMIGTAIATVAVCVFGGLTVLSVFLLTCFKR